MQLDNVCVYHGQMNRVDCLISANEVVVGLSMYVVCVYIY